MTPSPGFSAANFRIAGAATLSILAKCVSIRALRSSNPPGPSYKPGKIAMFLGERRFISRVINVPSQTYGFGVLSDSGATKFPR
jgi:hypothetical protein